MNTSEVEKESWLQATIWAVILGVVVAIGVTAIVLYYSGGIVAPVKVTHSWIFLVGGAAGLAVIVGMLWLFYKYEIGARSIKRTIGDFLTELGSEPF